MDVAAGGSYRVALMVATPTSGRQLRLTLDGVDVSGIIAVPTTGGWQVWQTVSVDVSLTAGLHVLRLAVVAGGLNLSWMDLY